MAGPVKDVVLIGKGQSELEDLMAQEAQRQGRYVTPENHPERGLFYRADHFPLAKRGVPVLLNMALAGAYDLQSGGRPAGERWLNDFTTNCYHQACDAWSASWNLGGAIQEADLFYAIGARLAKTNPAAAKRAAGLRQIRALTIGHEDFGRHLQFTAVGEGRPVMMRNAHRSGVEIQRVVKGAGLCGTALFARRAAANREDAAAGTRPGFQHPAGEARFAQLVRRRQPRQTGAENHDADATHAPREVEG